MEIPIVPEHDGGISGPFPEDHTEYYKDDIRYDTIGRCEECFEILVHDISMMNSG